MFILIKSRFVTPIIYHLRTDLSSSPGLAAYSKIIDKMLTAVKGVLQNFKRFLTANFFVRNLDILVGVRGKPSSRHIQNYVDVCHSSNALVPEQLYGLRNIDMAAFPPLNIAQRHVLECARAPKPKPCTCILYVCTSTYIPTVNVVKFCFCFHKNLLRNVIAVLFKQVYSLNCGISAAFSHNFFNYEDCQLIDILQAPTLMSITKIVFYDTEWLIIIHL